MKLINYRCSACLGYEKEEIFEIGDEIPEKLETLICPKCGGTLTKWNFKNNSQRWLFCDGGKG